MQNNLEWCKKKLVKFLYSILSRLGVIEKSSSFRRIPPPPPPPPRLDRVKDIQRSIVTDKNYGQLMKQLNLITDNDGLIRAKGRLSYSDLTYDTKFPILIPSRNLVTTLIIKECHKVVQHNGVKETLCQLRTKYWVCKARCTIKIFRGGGVVDGEGGSS